MQKANRIADATNVATKWTEENGEHLIKVSYHGDDLVFLIEGNTDGKQDHELPGLLKGEIPDGTPLIINRVPGARTQLPAVGDRVPRRATLRKGNLRKLKKARRKIKVKQRALKGMTVVSIRG